MKIKLRLDDQLTRNVWDASLRARAEVASWPAWKRGDYSARRDDMGRLYHVTRNLDNGPGKAQLYVAPSTAREQWVDCKRAMEIQWIPDYYLVVQDVDGAVDLVDQAQFEANYTVVDVFETPEFVLGADPDESRALNSTFVVHPTRPALVTYTTKIVASASLLAGTQVGRVRMLVGPGDQDPTDLADEHEHGISGVSISIETPSTRQMVALVPPGHKVRLATVTDAGTPAFSLIAHRERIL